MTRLTDWNWKEENQTILALSTESQVSVVASHSIGQTIKPNHLHTVPSGGNLYPPLRVGVGLVASGIGTHTVLPLEPHGTKTNSKSDSSPYLCVIIIIGAKKTKTTPVRQSQSSRPAQSTSRRVAYNSECE
ncbi:AAEL012516-PA [Aedes aegypti]|uniref:AAEL012516-PA n=1 Tax=Aedes aegypti TaxID=7159 RepID=Q16LV0_AEDAE|nr:AAEL012516-PA [Aedes aegypti]